MSMRGCRAAVVSILIAVSSTGAAMAQIGPGPFAVFPSPSTTDGRFLGFGCPGTATFEQAVTIGMAVPAEETSFTVSLFDGDTGKVDGVNKRHWDLGTRQIVLSIYADPLRQLNTSSTNLVGSWKGNDPNPTSGPFWTASAATMPDNDWWGTTITTSPQAQAPSGNYFYTLVIQLDGACAAGESLESNLKIAASNPMAFLVPRFGLVAPMRQVFNDGPILYPGTTFPPPGNDYLSLPTTYDGTFEFFFSLPPGETDLRLFDGDFDFGTAGLVATPSGTVLAPCADLDDLDTPATYDDFPFSTAGINPEGIKGAGLPADDSTFDAFRRGEPGSPGRIGCVRYEVTDPQGTVYRNDNPSGSFEWEQFRIAAQLAFDPSDSDYTIGTDYLPAGVWKVRAVGVDLSNLNFFYADACSTRIENGSSVAACPTVSPYLLGDTVWYDANGNGVQDASEPGISGVVLELYKSLDAPVFARMITGDTTDGNWPACVLKNTGLDQQGLYCFGVNDPGDYVVRVAAENFQPGGALYGYTPTNGNQLSNTLVDGNVLTYDFGYRSALSPGTGTIGYWKNHSEDWPVETITVGGVTYTKTQAISLMGNPGKGDKTYDLFKQLVAARLNVIIGNDPTCVAGTITATDAWLAFNPPGSNVKSSSAAWTTGGPLHQALDDYNNGRLCAPHRG
jgi:hypothetical protein